MELGGYLRFSILFYDPDNSHHGTLLTRGIPMPTTMYLYIYRCPGHLTDRLSPNH